MTFRLLGLAGPEWLAIVIICLMPLLLMDVLVAHYRSSFKHPSQYLPFLTGTLLFIAALLVVFMPQNSSVRAALVACGWLNIVSGLLGFVIHQYYGTFTQPGGYRLWLHYAMYAAPILAPLALSAMGFLALLCVAALRGAHSLGGWPIRDELLTLTSVSLLASSLQAGILHYRGAFNNVFMYVPVSVPVLAVLAWLWSLVLPSAAAHTLVVFLLWLTFIAGFVGLGLHLRGLDRQMGGLYVTVFNILQGPPVWAPAVFSGFAAVGLISLYLVI